MQNITVKITKGRQLKACLRPGVQGQQGIKGDTGDTGVVSVNLPLEYNSETKNIKVSEGYAIPSNSKIDEWNNKSNFSGNYIDLMGIPSFFTPSAHTQDISSINGLAGELNSKVNISEYDSKINQDVRITASPSFVRISVINPTSSSGQLFSVYGYQDNSSGVVFGANKGRGTLSNPSSIIAGDGLLAFDAYGYNGTGWSRGGLIVLQADVTPSPGNIYVPSSWYFRCATNSTTYPNNIFIINSAQRVGVNALSNAVLNVKNIKNSSDTVIIAQGMDGQTGDYLQVKDSSSNILANIDKNGIYKASGYKSSDGSTGTTGSFTSADGKIVTVKSGLITSII